jgi:hypothetical protein
MIVSTTPEDERNDFLSGSVRLLLAYQYVSFTPNSPAGE